MSDRSDERAAGRLAMRCPRLGHEVELAYCEREGGDLPCVRIIACWQGFLPIAARLQQRLSPQEWERFRRLEPKDKMTSLLELIEKAKRRRAAPAD
jgi:hypothetical protein